TLAPPPGSVPTSTVTGGTPPLPPVIVPALVVTEPTTSVVLGSGVSLKSTPLAAPLPLLLIVIRYCSVSPGEGPVGATSTSTRSVLLALSTGAAVTGVTVGSPPAGVLGSSVGTLGTPVALTVP